MGFKSIVSQKSFWKSVILLGVSFLVIYNFVSMLFEYGGIEIATFFRERTEDGKLFRFILGQFVAALAYGFIIAFGQFKMKEKEDSRNK
ncbi:MAG: hypothetical protein RI572_11205 [Salegentibacter sp.]|uniref:Uncharacterized protein n=1 Tax=Salegentibacter flavus TaxID=287099 RepID=A0A1I4YVX6_9FLAO|nr:MULTISPECIES: hypothetical protein [Salegentibacter]MDR9457965.1 hypothetical protein [Salegentibacter sp.]SFN42178.1 hypothetical protein SAMN05660413_00982 [Salegentibacter flavus]